jgi:hypothetical protein
MPDCKACGKWFATMEQCELCPTCERALERLRNYAVPVVRCKDCKYSCKDGNGRSCEGYWYELSEYDVTVKDDDFCSYGEGKDYD